MEKQVRRSVPRPFNLHWGKGQIVEEASVVSEHHEPSIQLLEFEDGELLVRFCYYDHSGRFQRSPLVVGQHDVTALRAALVNTPRLRSILEALVA